MNQRLEEIRKVRLQRRKELLEKGINPYPARLSGKDYLTASVAKSKMGENASVRGRIMSLRVHGNITFMDLKDESGSVQLFFQKNDLKDLYKLIKKLDIGDFLAASGEVFKTKAGEVTVRVDEFQLLTKSINPLPSTFHGLKDVEERYRKRYLDILINSEVKQRLDKRSKIISAMRNFLDSRGFIEVETPTLQPIYGGGYARPFVTHHNALDSEFYLRISDEMYLKRLIVGGFEKVYEITKVFRNEGVDHDHNPEFTMFEAQIAYKDYRYGMDITEEMIEKVAKEVFGTTEFNYQGEKISVKRPWKRMSVVESIKKYTGHDPLVWETVGEAKTMARKLVSLGEDELTDLEKCNKIGQVIALVFEEAVEEKLRQPTFIYDYPIEISPLAKKSKDPRFTERFELFAFGSELGNNYSELNDPVDLKERFLAEKDREKAGFDEAHQTDYDYLEAIEHGFPPTCGLGIGVDRLVMMMTDAANIREVIAFPTLKPLAGKSASKSKAGSAKESELKIADTASYGNLSKEISSTFPGFFYAYTVLRGVKIKKEDKGLHNLQKKVIDTKKGLSIKEIQEIPSVSRYREIFKKTGVSLSTRRPSPEALLRRVSQEKGIYKVNTAVDAYNIAVLETGIAIGGFDLDKMTLPFTLRFAREGEEINLIGEKDPTVIKKGEIVYADQKNIMTLDLNYRDSDHTKLTEKTNNILLVADGAPGISTRQVKSALEKSAKYIQLYCGGEIEKVVLKQ